MTPAPAEKRAEGEAFRVERLKSGQLAVRRGDEVTAVRAGCCFPWSNPTRHISLRDDEEKEVVLISDLRELDEESRAEVERELAAAGFVLEITAVYEVKEEFEIRNWRVMTAQGKRTFQTARDEWPTKTPAGGILIRDVAGDLFHIEDPATLDQKSRKLIWAFVD